MRMFEGESPTLWTRGAGCAELASLLSPVETVRVEGDLTEACLRQRADAVVSRRLSSSFDLVPQIVPDDVDLERSGSIVAAVSGGPHSPLAAAVAARLGQVTGLGASMVCAYRDEAGMSSAVSLIEDLYAAVPGIEYRLIEASDAQSLMSQLDDDATLVLGAPGGSWLQRTFFGQGAKLIQAAEAGVIVVRSAPRRAFQQMDEPAYVAPLREAAEVARMHRESRLAVADGGRLVGVVRRAALEGARAGALVADVMDTPVWVDATAAVEDCIGVWKEFAPDRVPVVDGRGLLVGGLTLD